MLDPYASFDGAWRQVVTTVSKSVSSQSLLPVSGISKATKRHVRRSVLIAAAMLLTVTLIAGLWLEVNWFQSGTKQNARTSRSGNGRTYDSCGYQLGSAIYDKWILLGGNTSFLGCAVTDEKAAARSPKGTAGRWARFGGGDGAYIVWHENGPYAGQAFEVHGCMFTLYASMNGTSSWLGFPISDEKEAPNGRRSIFESGYIHLRVPRSALSGKS